MSGEITIVARGETLDSVLIRLDIADRELQQQLERNALRAEIARVIAQHLAHRAVPGGAGLAHTKLERERAYIQRCIPEPLHIDRRAAAVHSSPFHFSPLVELPAGH